MDICGYLHNRYSHDIGTSTRQIFIQRVEYGGPTTCIILAPLTSIVINSTVKFTTRKLKFILSIDIFIDNISDDQFY